MTEWQRRLPRYGGAHSGLIESKGRVREGASISTNKKWNSYEIGSLFVVTLADKRHAKRVVKHAETMLQWIDDFMPNLGKDTYVRPPIIRIFKNWEAEKGYRDAGGGETNSGWEILMHKDSEGSSGYEFSWLNRELLQHWLVDSDPDFYLALPPWLWDGLRRFVEAGRIKNRKMGFQRDSWDRDEVRMLSRRGQLRPIEQLVSVDFEQWAKIKREDREIEAGAFIDYLVSAQAKKNKHAKNMLEDYFECFGEILAKHKPAVHERAGVIRAKKKEAGESLKNSLFDAWKEVEGDVLSETFDRSFGKWTEFKWKALERAYVEAIR